MATIEDFLHDFPDRGFRTLLSDPKNLAELVDAVAPEIASGFDFSQAELLPREFLMEDWRKREGDLLFRIPFRWEQTGRTVFVCILVEHQSTADPRMPLRILVYIVLYWEREWREWEQNHAEGEPLRLSPVLPIVFHTGSRAWSTNRSIAEIIDGPDELKQMAPQTPLLFWDLAERTIEELLEETHDWLRSLAVVRAESGDEQVFRDVLEAVIKKTEHMADEDRVRWQDLMRFLLSWAFRRRPEGEHEEIRDLASRTHENRKRKREVEKMAQTLTDTWDDILVRRLKEGREEERLSSLRSTLIDLLQERFDDKVPAELIDRVNSCEDVDTLRSCIRQMIHIDSPDELSL